MGLIQLSDKVVAINIIRREHSLMSPFFGTV